MRTLLILLACLSLEAQTLRLRVGGPDSTYRVTAISNTNPAVITVVKLLDSTVGTHPFLNGDTIYIHDVYGCTTANGYRKVINTNQAAGTFAITGSDDVNVVCDHPFDNTYSVGFLGKVENFTVNSISPRVFFPQSGAILSRNADPDGAPAGSCSGGPTSMPNQGGTGCAVAPIAVENDVAWQGMITLTTPQVTPNSACDGATASLCPAENAFTLADPAVNREAFVRNAAQIWFADNSKIGYLKAAKYWLNHIEEGLIFRTPSTDHSIRNFPMIEKNAMGGLRSGIDYLTTYMSQIALAYDLVRNEMTTGERTALANKLLNDYTDGCVNSLEVQSGTASTTAGSVSVDTVSGTGFSAYLPGDVIVIRHVAPYGLLPSSWARVVSVASDTSITVNWFWTPVNGPGGTYYSPGNFSEKEHYKVNRTWESNMCGAWQAMETHVGGRFPATVPVGYFQSTGSVPNSASSTTINLGTPGYSTIKHLSVPFFALMDSELVKITALSTTSITFDRGQMGTIPASHNNKIWGAIQRQIGELSGLTSTLGLLGDFQSNHAYSKIGGLLSTLQALIADDPRAAGRYEAIHNSYWYDILYPNVGKLQTGNAKGGVAANHYFWQRFNQYLIPPMLGSRNMTTVSNDFGTGFLWKVLQAPYMITTPKNDKPPSSTSGTYTASQTSPILAMASMLYPGLDAERANYWLKQKSGLHTASQYSNQYNGLFAGMIAAFNPVNSVQSDYKLSNLWNFFNDPEVGLNGNALLVSKSGWTDNDSVVLSWIPKHPVDHVTDAGSAVAGSYVFWKGGHLLLGMDTTSGMGSGFSNETLYTNTMDVGGPTTLRSAATPDWVVANRNPILRNPIGTSDYVYGLVDANQQYKATANVTGSYRHELHLKPVNGIPEYWITYDDHKTSTATVFTSRQFYQRRTDSSAVFNDLSTNSDFTLTRFRQPTPVNGPGDTASVRTAILYPAGGTLPTATTSTTSAGNTRVAYVWPPGTAAEQISVNLIGQDTTNAMPPVRLLTATDPNFRGLEIDDADQSRAELFGRGGIQYSSASFSTTFAQAGKLMVTSLLPGLYSVFRDDVTYLTDQVVDLDGTILLTSPPASSATTSWSILRVGSSLPTLVLDKSSIVFPYVLGGSLPIAQMFEASCLDGQCTTTVTPGCSWITPSPNSGLTPLTYWVNVDVSNKTAGTYTCNLTVSAIGAQGSPAALTVTLNIDDAVLPLEILTTWLEWGKVGAPYSKTLGLIGGVPPYSWSVISGNLPEGLSLTTGGLLAGTPTRQEITSLTVEVTDSGSPIQTDTANYLLVVEPSADAASLTILPAGFAGNRLSLRYGNKSFPAQQICVLTLSATPSFSTSLETFTDTQGPSRRAHIFGLSSTLQPSTDYYVQAVCPSGTVSATLPTIAPAGGPSSINYSFRPPPSRGIAKVSVEYGATESLGGTVTQNCLSSCTAVIPGTAGGVLYLRHRYLNASDQTLAFGALRIATVP